MYVDDNELIVEYIKDEQSKTRFDLQDKLCKPDIENGVLVTFNPLELNLQRLELLMALPQIIQDSGEIGEFEIDIFKVFISSLETYEKELIVC